MGKEWRAVHEGPGGVVRGWYGFYAAVAHAMERVPDEAAFAVGMLWRCENSYGFGAEVGRA